MRAMNRSTLPISGTNCAPYQQPHDTPLPTLGADKHERPLWESLAACGAATLVMLGACFLPRAVAAHHVGLGYRRAALDSQFATIMFYNLSTALACVPCSCYIMHICHIMPSSSHQRHARPLDGLAHVLH